MTRINLVSFIWGFAEATFFFIVPDVWLTFLALRFGGKKLLSAVGFSVLGALAGGILIYAITGRFQDRMFFFFDHIPGIQMTSVEEARRMMAGYGLMALPIGVLKGIPYKIFAAEWRLEGGGIALFILMSILARAGRFLISAGITRWVSLVCEARMKYWNKLRTPVWAGFWGLFYLFYFYHTGW